MPPAWSTLRTHLHTQRYTFLLLSLGLLIALIAVYQIHLPQVIDVGSGRDTPFIRGFSFRENSDNGDHRWTTGRAEIRFWGVGDQQGTLTLRIAAPRPVGTIQVWANGIHLQDITPSAVFDEYRFWLERGIIGWRGDLVVTLQSETFTQPPDTRVLGVQVDSVRFEWGDGLITPAPSVIFLLALVWHLVIVANAWSKNARLGQIAGGVTLLVGATGFALARYQTAWFIVPLYLTALIASGAAWAFASVLQASPRPLSSPSFYFGDLQPGKGEGEGFPVRAMFVVMLFAFAARMMFAFGPGFIVDTQDYIVWSYKLATYGLGTAYVTLEGLWAADQSPVLLYIFDLMGQIYRAVFAPDFMYPAVAGDPNLRALTTNPAALADPVHLALLRIPFILADVLTGALILKLIWNRATIGGALAPRWRGWLIACAYWFNPAVIWNDAYWGQTDAMHTVLVVAAFALILSRRVTFAFFALGIALLTKPQAAIFAPMLLLLAWRAEKFLGFVRAVIGGGIGLVVALAPIVFAGGGAGLLAYLVSTVGHHPTIATGAHNLWVVWLGDQAGGLDTGAVFPNLAPWLSYRALSLILFTLFYLLAFVKLWRAKKSHAWQLAAYAAFAFFILPTEIHENYGFAALAILAVAIPNAPRAVGALFACLTLTMTLNYALSDPGVFARLGVSDPDLQLASARYANSVLNLALFAAWTAYEFARGLLMPKTKSLEPQGV